MLPTREEVKNIVKDDKQYWNELSVKEINIITSVVNAYVSGTLIEARTEGEIAKIIFNFQHKDSALIPQRFCGTQWDTANECEKIEAKRLAHALVGKV